MECKSVSSDDQSDEEEQKNVSSDNKVKWASPFQSINPPKESSINSPAQIVNSRQVETHMRKTPEHSNSNQNMFTRHSDAKETMPFPTMASNNPFPNKENDFGYPKNSIPNSIASQSVFRNEPLLDINKIREAQTKKPDVFLKVSEMSESINAMDKLQNRFQSMQVTLEKDSRIEARYRGKAKYYPGKIMRCRFDGTYDILYDDGERELGVSKELIRFINSDNNINKLNDKSNDETPIERQEVTLSKSTITSSFKIGDSVEARYRGKGKNFYKGTIVKIDIVSNTCNIDYEDGDKDIGLALEHVRRLGGDAVIEPVKLLDVKSDDGINSSELYSTPIDVGTRVEVRYRGKGRYYPGKVSHIRQVEGTYDIDYDDGEKEFGVSRDLIRVLSPSPTVGVKVNKPEMINSPVSTMDRIVKNDTNEPSLSTITKLRVGMKIEARYRGKAKYYPGKIIRCRFDGTTFDILYDDGERELGVSRELIRIINITEPPKNKSNDETNNERQEVTSSNNNTSSFKIGDSIEARYRGKGKKFYKGTIVKVDIVSNTCNIDYEDGDKDIGLALEHVRRLGGDVATEKTQALNSKSDEQNINVPNSSEKQNTAMKSSVSGMDRIVNATTNNASTNNDTDSTTLSVGMKVEARYRGKAKYYPGKIMRCRLDGTTFDILYDDGERELGVSKELIRVINTDNNSNMVNDNDKSTDDGITDRQEGISSNNHSSPFKIGDSIEARYRGKGKKFYKGTIVKIDVMSNTCNIDYADGDKDIGLALEHVRRLGGDVVTELANNPELQHNDTADSSIIDDTKLTNLRLGMKVEARYRGKGKFYPGKITRLHVDDTYDILYDDGEREMNIPRHLIKELSTSAEKNENKGEESSTAVNNSSSHGVLSGEKKVLALFQGGNYDWHEGTVLRVLEDGSCDIRFNFIP